MAEKQLVGVINTYSVVNDLWVLANHYHEEGNHEGANILLRAILCIEGLQNDYTFRTRQWSELRDNYNDLVRRLIDHNQDHLI